jgi:hypothetical protein
VKAIKAALKMLFIISHEENLIKGKQASNSLYSNVVMRTLICTSIHIFILFLCLLTLHLLNYFTIYSGSLQMMPTVRHPRRRYEREVIQLVLLLRELRVAVRVASS